MQQARNICNIILVIIVIVFANFFFLGVTKRTSNSWDYSIPMAKSFLSTEFLTVSSHSGFMYYPAASYILLAPFVLVGFPNLFGLLSWVVLFYACKKLGDTFELNRYMSIIFAASICTTISVIRTIGDQSIDKWVCTWFVFSLILLEKPQRTWKWSFFIGLTFGLLIGSKYSGPFFLLALLIIYWKTLVRKLNFLRFLYAGVIFSIVGLFWYVRNIILTGSPYYPAKLPFLKGSSEYVLDNWMLWNIPFKYPQGLKPLLDAFLSEYGIWAFSGVVIVWYFWHSYRRKQNIDNKLRRVIILSLTTGLACLFLPITPARYFELFHIISNMRYIYSFMVMLVLAVFLIAEKYKKNELLAIVSLLNVVSIFSFVSYQPKIDILCICGFVLIFWLTRGTANLYFWGSWRSWYRWFKARYMT